MDVCRFLLADTKKGCQVLQQPSRDGLLRTLWLPCLVSEAVFAPRSRNAMPGAQHGLDNLLRPIPTTPVGAQGAPVSGLKTVLKRCCCDQAVH